MKRLIIFIFTLVTIQGRAQYLLEFVNPHVVSATEFQITIKVKATGSDFILSGSNLRFNYNNTGLDFFTTVPGAGIGNVVPGSLLAQNGYTSIAMVKTLTTPAIATVNFNHVIGSTTGILVNATGVDIITVKFVITDPTKLAQLYWNLNSAQTTNGTYVNQATSPSNQNTILQKRLIDGSNVQVQADATAFNNSLLNLAAPSVPLPITLKSFTARALDYSNLIEWTTSVEVNTKTHSIERSLNGTSNWTLVGKVLAAGNSNAEQSYAVEDKSPLVVSYYRLRTEDLDGTESLSDIVNVTRKTGQFSIINSFPSPAKEQINIQFNAVKESVITLQIFDVNGREVITEKIDVSKGIHLADVHIETLAAGTYFAKISDGLEYSEPYKFVKE